MAIYGYNCPMARARAAGIRELKDNLSEYVRRAEAGERIAVTAHGRVVAMLGPAEKEARGRPRSRFDALVAEGVIRLPAEAGDPLEDWPTTTIRLPKGTAAALIDADRDED
jgi:prevent-host-death family protein